jgi:soluble lytic murein transglycosylase-like protein
MFRHVVTIISGFACTVPAYADVFELNANGDAVNVTTPRWKPQAAKDMQSEGGVPVQAQSAAPQMLLPLTQINYHPIVEDAAARYALPPALLDAVIRQESGYRSDAVSPVGAMGLMQLMPGTARSLGVSNAFDPVQNVNGGAAYLRIQLNRFGGNLDHALAAYNAGPGAVIRYGGVPPYRETQIYVNSILGRMAVPLTNPAGK